MPAQVKWTKERLEEVADHLNRWVDESISGNKKQFLLGDFCFQSGLGFHPYHFYRYAGHSLKLDAALAKAKSWQAHCLAKGALYNKFNYKVALMLLANFHKEDGYDDISYRHTITTTGEVLKQLDNSKELVPMLTHESINQNNDAGSNQTSPIAE